MPLESRFVGLSVGEVWWEKRWSTGSPHRRRRSAKEYIDEKLVVDHTMASHQHHTNRCFENGTCQKHDAERHKNDIHKRATEHIAIGESRLGGEGSCLTFFSIFVVRQGIV